MKVRLLTNIYKNRGFIKGELYTLDEICDEFFSRIRTNTDSIYVYNYEYEHWNGDVIEDSVVLSEIGYDLKRGSPSEDLVKAKRYNSKGKIECIEVILDQELDFCEGSILKYLWRYKEKGGAADLKKAKYYLEKLIEREEKQV